MLDKTVTAAVNGSLKGGQGGACKGIRTRGKARSSGQTLRENPSWMGGQNCTWAAAMSTICSFSAKASAVTGREEAAPA